MIVSLEEIKRFMRIDFDDDDELLEQLLLAAEDRCRKVSRNPFFAEDPNAPVAIEYTVAYLYEHREDADNNALNLSLRALLFGNREVQF